MFAMLASQPPSGGCVLKLDTNSRNEAIVNQPPSGGCVLKQFEKLKQYAFATPAAFRRLCVETFISNWFNHDAIPSRLQAAVC